MTDFELTPGPDPVPPEWRRADPARDRLSRTLENEVEVGTHIKYDEPFDPDETQWEQRVHIVSYPPGYEPPLRPNHGYHGPLTAGWVYWLAGAWFWRPSWSWDGAPSLVDLGLEQEPSEELKVDTEEEAVLHARRRVAWQVAE